jgi:hypothetical protein
LLVNPATIALIAGSMAATAFMIYASITGLEILRSWDIKSGSAGQLQLERKTFLVSTLLSCVMLYQLVTLLMFIYTADHIHSLFVGAMCAAGTLNVNSCGYATLNIKLLNAVLCGLWIVVNHVDGKAFDYPLIRFKYKFLLIITALNILETLLLWKYLSQLDPAIITSCCGILFSEEAPGITGDIAHLSSYTAKIIFFASAALILRLGIQFVVTKQAAKAFSFLALWFFSVGLASIISFIAVHYYELPTHHCPFCLLQREYHYIGYPLYLTWLSGGVLGISVGLVDRFRFMHSLREIVPSVQKRLCIASLVCFALFVMIALYPMIFSDFVLEGY